MPLGADDDPELTLGGMAAPAAPQAPPAAPTAPQVPPGTPSLTAGAPTGATEALPGTIDEGPGASWVRSLAAKIAPYSLASPNETVARVTADMAGMVEGAYQALPPVEWATNKLMGRMPGTFIKSSDMDLFKRTADNAIQNYPSAQAMEQLTKWGVTLYTGLRAYGAGSAVLYPETGAALAPTGLWQNLQQMAGGAVGIGALTAGNTAAEQELREADPKNKALPLGTKLANDARSFAVGAGSTLLLDGMFRGTAKLLIPSARSVDPAVVEQNYRSTAAPAYVQETTQRFEAAAREAQASAAADKAVADQASDLYKASLTTPTPEGIPYITPEEVATARATARKSAQAATSEEARATQTTLQAYQRYQDTPIPPTWYTSERPSNPGELSRAIHQTYDRYWRSPEGYKGIGGVSGARAFAAMDRAAYESDVGEWANDAVIPNLFNRAAQLLNNGDTSKGGEFFRPVVEAWETAPAGQGRAAVEAQFGPEVANVMEELNGVIDHWGTQLHDLGAMTKMDPAKLARMGTPNYFPHSLDPNLSPQEIESRWVDGLMNQGMDRAEAEAQVARFGQLRRQGYASAGSIDNLRTMPGSASAKLDAGMPLDPDPFRAAYNYSNDAARRAALARQFGPNLELKDPMIQAIVDEGGSRKYFQTWIDSQFDLRYPDEAMRRLVNNLTDWNVATKMTFSALPHTFQGINSVVSGSPANTFRAMTDELRGTTTPELQRLTGTAASMWDQWQRIEGGDLLQGDQTIMDKVARSALRYGQFERAMRMGRLINGGATAYQIVDDISQAVDGRLRGQAYDIMARRMGRLGIDVPSVVSKVRAGEDLMNLPEIQQAIYTGMRNTQFVGSRVLRPAGWNQIVEGFPIGRLVFQFQHYGFNQAKFIRDQVLAEAAKGNYVPLSKAMVLYPLAGEAVADIKSQITGKERPTGIGRYADDMAHAVGFGLVGSMYESALRGRLIGQMAGPTARTIEQFAENALRQGPLRATGQYVTSQPIWQGTAGTVRKMLNAGAWTYSTLKDFVHAHRGTPGSASSVEDDPELVDLSTLDAQQRARQGQ